MRLAENALAKEIWPRPSVTRMLGNLISNCLLQRQFRAGGTLVTANMTKIATTHVVLEKKIGEGAFGAVYSGGWRAAAGYAGAADTTSKLTAANAADGGEDEQRGKNMEKGWRLSVCTESFLGGSGGDSDSGERVVRPV